MSGQLTTHGSVARQSPEGPITVRVWRFSGWARATHLTLALSVFGLILTGMPLKYAEAFWAWPLMRLWGGAARAGVWHRVFAVGLMSAGLMHLSGLAAAGFTGRLPRLFGPDSMVPRLEDARHIAGYLRYLRGQGPRPEFGKYTYWEKFDYFAEYWGTFVFGVTGLIMWFPERASALIPGWAVNGALILHSYEALLATGFLFAIHFFNTHLRPDAFPFEQVIIMGRQSLEKVAHERPGWHSRISSNPNHGTRLTPGRDDRAPTPILVGGIAFLVLGTGTLLLVMSAAIAEAVTHLIAALT